MTALVPLLALGQPANAVHRDVPASPGFVLAQEDNNVSIDELLKRRIDKEFKTYGITILPEIVRTESNYIRSSAADVSTVLYETSFHLEPHYYPRMSAGADSNRNNADATQDVMYFTGAARTPLALPIVSNLSKALRGDEASYTVHLGILPLPRHPGMAADSMRYYVVIERAIESNHTDNEVHLERFAKECATKVNEPIVLRLENAPPERNAYIVRLENGTVLDFYEDFARFFQEHILINSERLGFTLGKNDISAISSRLSIPYSVARASNVTVELLSVIDTAHPLVIVDTLRRPAQYLAELDMKQFADGPYRYRFSARDPSTNHVLFTETKDFNKNSPVVFGNPGRLVPSDTLEVGGKKIDYKGYISKLSQQVQEAVVKSERLDNTLNKVSKEKKTLEDIVNANKRNTIAGIAIRSGVVFGASSGMGVMVGIESSSPSLAFDLSFGFLYSSVPVNLSYTPASNFSQFTSSPKSLGFQLSFIPVKLWGGLIEPVLGVGYYGIWSTPTTPTGLRSATLLSFPLGLATEPLGENTGLGASLTLGPTFGLGLSQPSQLDVSFRAYIRF